MLCDLLLVALLGGLVGLCLLLGVHLDRLRARVSALEARDTKGASE